MTSDQLRAAFTAKPFAPFTMRLADGSTVRVPSPGFMWLHPGGRTVFVATCDGGHIVIDLLLVAALEVSNGRARPRRR